MKLPIGVIYHGSGEVDGVTHHRYTDIMTGTLFLLQEADHTEKRIMDTVASIRQYCRHDEVEDDCEPVDNAKAIGVILIFCAILTGLALLLASRL